MPELNPSLKPGEISKRLSCAPRTLCLTCDYCEMAAFHLKNDHFGPSRNGSAARDLASSLSVSSHCCSRRVRACSGWCSTVNFSSFYRQPTLSATHKQHEK